MPKKLSTKLYRIQVIGCDDVTDLTIDLDIHEFRLIDRIARLITDNSAYKCQPTMQVYEISEE